ncbi:hypothetical protein IMCC9480_1668 [Oxalobacteraceae bacterium IMCC9480]|nr:hypothetical protein IMCC9480_1668 [Oxalobacteraceae bacterium IMCC9480]
MTALVQHIDFCAISRVGRVARTDPFFEHARTVNDAREPVGQHHQIGTDTGQQKDRRNRQLNDVSDIAELDFHGVVDQEEVKKREHLRRPAGPRIAQQGSCEVRQRQRSLQRPARWFYTVRRSTATPLQQT